MALKLDRNRPFGELMGAPYKDVPGAKYTQDGVFFDNTGAAILTAEQKAERKAALAAELAALSGDEEGTGPVAETQSIPVAPAAPEDPVAETPAPAVEPVKKAPAAKKKPAAAPALPPLPE